MARHRGAPVSSSWLRRCRHRRSTSCSSGRRLGAGAPPPPPPPLSGAFFAPPDLSGAPLLRSLVSLASELSSAPLPPFQRGDFAALRRKLSLLAVILESVLDESPAFSDAASLCFRELYVVLCHAELLVDHVVSAGRAWALLRGPRIAASFRDLDAEFAVVLDVLPAASVRLGPDARDHLDLLRAHCRGCRSSQYHDTSDAALRDCLLAVLRRFELSDLPDPSSLQSLLANIGISESDSCRAEIEYLEEQIMSQEGDTDLPLIGGVVALLRYCFFLLFDHDNATNPLRWQSAGNRKQSLSWDSGDDSTIAVPREFSCSISLELMHDPVVVSTGHTYDRPLIVQWIGEGQSCCPNSRQTLMDNQLVPNRALRSLISQWCLVHGVQYDALDSNVGMAQRVAVAYSGKAAIEVNKATARILVGMLVEGSDSTKLVAAREVRLLAKAGRQNRVFIAELGVIPLLNRLLLSPDWMAQENAVTALLNLSINRANKTRIMEEESCLKLIVQVLRCGCTIEAKENAAATLLSLSVVHDYKKMILSQLGAVEELAALLTKGTSSGKKDAAMALFNLSTHPESTARMVESGAVMALVEALKNDTLSEVAASALALLMKQPSVVLLVGSSETVITTLAAIMQRGNPKGKENGVACLYEMCRRGSSTLTRRVARTPGLSVLVQGITLTGTKRARKKANSVWKMCQRSQTSPAMALRSSLTMVDHSLIGNDALRPTTSFRNGEFSNPESITVHVP